MPLSTTPPSSVSSSATETTQIDANDFKFNTGKLLVEINRLKSVAQRNPLAIVAGHDGKNYKIEDYIGWLQGQALPTSSIGPAVEEAPGIELESIPTSRESLEAEPEQMIASLQGQILDAEYNVELIDKYILGLLTGKDFTEFTSMASNNNKFVKVAKDEKLEKFRKQEVLDPVEEYYNDLFDDTPGSPNYGTDMTHTVEELEQTKKASRFKIIK
jgi:hypothetical protein